MRKLLRKKLFDMLSHRHGAVVCVVCVVMLVTSVLHFGEVWLEWSHDKYGTMFSFYEENISGKTFQKKLCQYVPIDAVYTWVNGSDPIRAAELETVLHELREQISSGTDSFDAPFKCSFRNCVPSDYVIVSPGFPSSVEFSEVTSAWPAARDAIDVKQAVNETVFKFTSVEAAEKVVELTKVFYVGGLRFVVHLGYWTSESHVPFSKRSPTVVLVENLPKETLRSSNLTSKVVPSNLRSSVTSSVPHVQAKIAVIAFKSQEAALSFVQHSPVVRSSSIYHGFLILRNSPLLASVADTREKRFRDNDELRYSLRSLEMHAPWIRHVYLVTAGQIPHWLNLDNPHLTVVTHEEIFPNKSHLPTFSSPAIESHLHRIPGISEKFVYLNDDVFIGKVVWPEDFYSEIQGQKVYLSWNLPPCDPGCHESWIHDGSCDLACNNSACQFDGGDCDVNDGTLPNGVSPSLIDHDWNGWGDDVDGPYCAHMCANSWLADKYCDKSCDKPECGYDAGDCGEAKLQLLPNAQVPPNLNEVNLDLTLTHPAFVLNLTALATWMNVTSGVHSTHAGLRTVALSLKYRSVVVVVYKDAKNLTRMEMKLVGSRGNEEVAVNVKVNLQFAFEKPVEESAGTSDDYHWDWESQKKLNRVNASVVAKSERSDPELLLSEIQLAEVGRVDLKPPLDAEVDNVQFGSLEKELIKLRIEKEAGDLTGTGFFVKRGIVLHEFVAEFYSKHRKLPGSFINLTSHQKIEDTAIVALFHLAEPKNLTGPKQTLDSTRERLHSEFGAVRFKSRTLKDTFADSIRRVNNLFNVDYGFEGRRVPSHTPHLIDQRIMGEVQVKYKEEFEATSSHRLRTSVDMQYAFTYYYYLMSERETFDAGKIFDEFDTDHSGTWSDREIRTLLTRLNELPLTLEALTSFEEDLSNCALALPAEFSRGISTPAYERYVDSNLPTITKKLVTSCDPVVAKLKENFSQRKKYKFEIMPETTSHFKMLVSNVSRAIGALDDVRRNPRNFLCLNDDLDEAKPESETVSALRADFLESVFPIRSSFELPDNYRNRFLRVEELREWRRWRQGVRVVTYLCFFGLVVFSVGSFFQAQVYRAFRRLRSSRTHSLV